MKTIQLAFVLCFTLHSGFAAAGLDLLSTTEIRHLLGTFPAHGSAQELRDDDILLKYQASRTAEQCQAAAAQSEVNLQQIFAQPNGPLTASEFARSQFLLLKVAAKAGLNVLRAKDVFKRLRPYDRNREIIPCIPKENSTAYPSGHTTVSRVAARVLAAKYPRYERQLLEVAEQVALNRVLGGVHHPSDIEAGEKLADELAQRFLDDSKRIQ